ncbi:MAG: class I SAM-dependent methyltransferase [Myxococcales bacterium]|nr:class I SAM-dependent methyltransferase [Myxococcales bacterium]
MALFHQSRFPGLWRVFQYWIGGTVDKRSLCVRHYDGRSSVLEVGCSLGNISQAFRAYEGVRYTGVDVDRVVVEYARRTFASRPNFAFVCEDLADLARPEGGWGYVLFAGLCHHLDDAECRRMLSVAARLVADEGRLCVVDPLMPRSTDPWFVRQFVKLEQGEFVRSGAALRDLVESVPGLELQSAEEELIGSSPFHWPVCARFGVYSARPV